MLNCLKYFFIVAMLFPLFAFASNIEPDCSIKRYYLEDLTGISRFLCNQAIDRFKAGRQTAENVHTICRGTQEVAWRRDQDNSMLDANDKVSRSMGILRSLNGTSVGVQVCPGVYLATAHGALDNPSLARSQNRTLRSPLENLSSIFAFPLSRETRMSIPSDASFISPRLRDPSLWDREGTSRETDYVFIKVDQTVRPRDFVTPLNYEKEELLRASETREVDVQLYRPKTRYQTDTNGNPVERIDENGNLVFDDSTVSSRLSDMIPIFEHPQKVNRRCDIFNTNGDGLLINNCPSEEGVSGSPYVAEIDGEEYLLGLHVSSRGNLHIPEGDSSVASAQFIMSKQFCEDYQAACGSPCPSLADKISHQDEVSL